MKFPLTGSGGKGDGDRSDKKAFKAGYDQIDWSVGREERMAEMAALKERQYEEAQRALDAPMVMRDIETFVSPVDGSVISDRGQLRAHNKKHGVTNVRDYGDGYFDRNGREMHKRRQGNTEKDKTGRREAIRESLHKMGIHD